MGVGYFVSAKRKVTEAEFSSRQLEFQFKIIEDRINSKKSPLTKEKKCKLYHKQELPYLESSQKFKDPPFSPASSEQPQAARSPGKKGPSL